MDPGGRSRTQEDPEVPRTWSGSYQVGPGPAKLSYSIASAHSAGPRKKEGRHESLVVGIWGDLGAILGQL